MFQSLIGVACPTGSGPRWIWYSQGSFQSLIWVACPTGAGYKFWSVCVYDSFNPSYGLHALRADNWMKSLGAIFCFNPSYGLHALRALSHEATADRSAWGFNPSYGLHALRARPMRAAQRSGPGFNPSYGLHALRAGRLPRWASG